MPRSRHTPLAVAAASVAATALVLTAPLPSGAAPAKQSPSSPQRVASGLDNPRQLSFSRSGEGQAALYIAEAGVGGDGACIPGPEGEDVCFGRSGAITRVKAGHQDRVLRRLPSLAPEGGPAAIGPSDVIVRGKRIALTVGLGADPAERVGVGGPRLATVLTGKLGQRLRTFADVGDFETRRNPHPDAVDSNPVALLRRGHGYVVVDAGGNYVAKFGPHRRRLLAVLQNRLVPAPPGFPVPEIPMQPVPTSIAVGPDGAFYLSQLTGFPFLVGEANIYRLGLGGRLRVFASGLTHVTDLAWHRGDLYAVQIADAGLGAPTTGPPIGSLRKVTPHGSEHESVADGLSAPYGVTFRGDNAFVTTCAVCPDAGEVWKLPLGPRS